MKCPHCKGTKNVSNISPRHVTDGALAYLRANPGAELYRGDGGSDYYLSGAQRPAHLMGVAYANENVMELYQTGVLVQKWPDAPQVGKDALTVAH